MRKILIQIILKRVPIVVSFLFLAMAIYFIEEILEHGEIPVSSFTAYASNVVYSLSVAGTIGGCFLNYPLLEKSYPSLLACAILEVVLVVNMILTQFGMFFLPLLNEMSSG